MIRTAFDNIMNGLWGGMLLVVFRKRGLDYLKFGRANFYLSFAAPLLLVPLHWWIMQIDYQMRVSEFEAAQHMWTLSVITVDKTARFATYAAAHFSLFAATGPIGALAISPIALITKMRPGFPRFLIALNWVTPSLGLIMYLPHLGYTMEAANNPAQLDLVSPLTIAVMLLSLWAIIIMVWLLRTMLGARWYAWLLAIILLLTFSYAYGLGTEAALHHIIFAAAST